jgi:hypothetical protein
MRIGATAMAVATPMDGLASDREVADSAAKVVSAGQA